MLLSEIEENKRKLNVALGAGVSVVLFTLVAGILIMPEIGWANISMGLLFSVVAIAPMVIYLIYLLATSRLHKTLLDIHTRAYSFDAFMENIQVSNIKSIAIISMDNFEKIEMEYSTSKANKILRNMVQRLDDYSEIEGSQKNIISRYNGAKFLLASSSNSTHLESIIKGFILDSPTIMNIKIDYEFATVAMDDSCLTKTIKALDSKFLSNDRNFCDRTNELVSETEFDENDIRHKITMAIIENDIHFYFKPILDINTRQVSLFQISSVLVYNKQEIQPREYLPIISELGLSREYDYMLIEQLSIYLLLVDKRISFVFTISPSSISDSQFQKHISQLISNQKDTYRLIVSLYEKNIMNISADYFNSLHTMRTLGFGISLDNFGSTSSSDEYLKHFNYDMIQLDKSYTKKLDDAPSRERLRSVIDKVRRLDIITIAKWVDDKDKQEKLSRLGIDYAQGFLIGDSISEDELLMLYK